MSKHILLIFGLLIGTVIASLIIIYFIPLSADNLLVNQNGVEVCRATIDSNGNTYNQPSCPSGITVCTPPQAEINKVASCEVQANDDKGNPGKVVCITNPYIIFYLPPPQPKHFAWLSTSTARAADVLYTCSWYVKYQSLNDTSNPPVTGDNSKDPDNNANPPKNTNPNENNSLPALPPIAKPVKGPDDDSEPDGQNDQDTENNPNENGNSQPQPPLPISIVSCISKPPEKADDNAYRLVLVADKAASDSAKTIQCMLRQQIKPFSQMGNQLSIEIVEAQLEDMNCRRLDPAHPTSIVCNRDFLRKEGAKHNAHITAAITSAVTGGTAQGGLIMVSSLEEELLAGTIVHELGHAVADLGDEYEFKTEAQKAMFCMPARKRPNIISFVPAKSYTSDSAARDSLKSTIPWFSLIKDATPITTGKELGTNGADNIVDPSSLPFGLVGLFRSGGCNGVGIASWRPYGVPNFMVGPKDTNIPPYHSDLLVKAMGAARGEEIKLK